MVDLGVREVLAGVPKRLLEMTTGFKLTSENQFKLVVLLPREPYILVNGLQPSSCLIRLTEKAGKRIRIKMARNW